MRMRAGGQGTRAGRGRRAPVRTVQLGGSHSVSWCDTGCLAAALMHPPARSLEVSTRGRLGGSPWRERSWFCGSGQQRGKRSRGGVRWSLQEGVGRAPPDLPQAHLSPTPPTCTRAHPHPAPCTTIPHRTRASSFSRKVDTFSEHTSTSLTSACEGEGEGGADGGSRRQAAVSGSQRQRGAGAAFRLRDTQRQLSAHRGPGPRRRHTAAAPPAPAPPRSACRGAGGRGRGGACDATQGGGGSV